MTMSTCLLTSNFEDTGGAVSIGLAGDFPDVLQVRVLEHQLPLLPLHHDLDPPVLDIDLLAVPVPGDLCVIRLHIDLELTSVMLHNILTLQL